MNFWLKFNVKMSEQSYQSHIIKNNKFNQFKLLIFISLCVGILKSVATIFEFLFCIPNNCPNTSQFTTKVLFIAAGVTLFAGLMIVLSKYYDKLSKYIELLKFIIFLALQIIYDGKLITNDKNYEGYGIFWQCYENQMLTLVLLGYLNNWVSKMLYLFILTGYYGLIRVQSIYDKIMIVEQFGFCIVIILTMYFFERNSRENFNKFLEIVNKEKAWESLLNHLPETIVVMSLKKQIKFRNEAFFECDFNGTEKKIINKCNSEDVNDANEQFINRVNSLRLRGPIQDIKSKKNRSLIINSRLDSKIALLNLHQAESAKTKSQNFHEKSDHSIVEVLHTLNNNTHSLQNVLNLLNPEIKALKQNHPQLTFDGIYINKPIEFKLIPIEFEGQPCFLMIIFDTTQRDIVAIREENDRYKNIVLSSVSHELRNPLNSAISKLQLVVDDITLPSKIRDDILLPSLRSLGVLTKIINDVLDFSRIGAENVKLVFQSVDIRRLVYDSCISIEKQCQSKGLKLRVIIDSDVPEILITDPHRLGHILLNLLSNALKFTHTGTIKVIIKCKDIDQGLISITVEDTGRGIKSEDIPTLFQEYDGIPNVGEKKTMGLAPSECRFGLSISQKLAKSLGKADLKDENGIKVISKVNEGSKFCFIIHDKKSTPRDAGNPEKFNPIFNKYPINEEDFDILIDEGMKQNAEQYITDGVARNDFEDDDEDEDENDQDQCDYNYLTINSVRPFSFDKKYYYDIDLTAIKILLISNNKQYLKDNIKKTLDHMNLRYEIGYSLKDINKIMDINIKKECFFDMIIVDGTIQYEQAYFIIKYLKTKMKNIEIPLIPIIGCVDIIDDDLKVKYDHDNIILVTTEILSSKEQLQKMLS